MHCTQACTYTLHTSHGTCMKQSWHMYDAASLNTVSLQCLSQLYTYVYMCICAMHSSLYIYTAHESWHIYEACCSIAQHSVSPVSLAATYIYM